MIREPNFKKIASPTTSTTEMVIEDAETVAGTSTIAIDAETPPEGLYAKFSMLTSEAWLEI